MLAKSCGQHRPEAPDPRDREPALPPEGRRLPRLAKRLNTALLQELPVFSKTLLPMVLGMNGRGPILTGTKRSKG